MTARRPRHIATFKKAQAADEAWAQAAHGHGGLTIAGPTVADVERTDPIPRADEDGEEITHAFFTWTRVRGGPSTARLCGQCVKKRLGNRSVSGESRCHLCGTFSQLEHRETCSTAEATRGQCACVHAMLGGFGTRRSRSHDRASRNTTRNIQAG